MTVNDRLFLEKVHSLSKENKESETKKSLVTSVGLLSNELLTMFGINKEHKGGWFFNVYVEFEPMFRIKEAEDWQK